MNEYKELKEKHAQEMAAFAAKNMFYAFDDKQYKEGLRKLGASGDDVCETIGGGFVRTEKAEDLTQMLLRMSEEIDTRARSDQRFALEMFRDALAQTEFHYTGDYDGALDLLGYTLQDVLEDDTLTAAFREATEPLTEFTDSVKVATFNAVQQYCHEHEWSFDEFLTAALEAFREGGN